MHFVLFLILTTLGLWTRRGYTQDVTVFLTPLEFNAVEGQAVTFSCFSSNVIGLLWRVDNLVLPDNRLSVRGITGLITTNENRNFQSQITIPATPENDNSSVRCDGIDGGGGFVRSPIATFRVQGLLDPPSNLTIVDDDPSHKRLTWEPPASLNITDVEPDISGYRICTNLTEVCINTTELEYVFPNLRIPIQFSVTAVNLVGESNASVALHEPCDPSTGMKIALVSSCLSG